MISPLRRAFNESNLAICEAVELVDELVNTLVSSSLLTHPPISSSAMSSFSSVAR